MTGTGLFGFNPSGTTFRYVRRLPLTVMVFVDRPGATAWPQPGVPPAGGAVELGGGVVVDGGGDVVVVVGDVVVGVVTVVVGVAVDVGGGTGLPESALTTWTCWHGADRVQGLALSPVVDTHIFFAWGIGGSTSLGSTTTARHGDACVQGLAFEPAGCTYTNFGEEAATVRSWDWATPPR